MASLPTFNASTEPTAAQWQTLLPIKAIKGSDQTISSNSTFQNDTALVLPLAANAIYEFRLRFTYNSGATPALKTQITLPAGATANMAYEILSAGAYKLLPSTNALTALDGGASDIAACAWGEITTSGTSGNVQFQWAQNTLTASNTTVRAGSSLILRQIG